MLEKYGGENVDWINLAQDRDQKRVLNVHDNGSSGSIKGDEFLDRLLKDLTAQS
jgi:hypothetical protein